MFLSNKIAQIIRPLGRDQRSARQKQRDEDRTYALVASNAIFLLLVWACFELDLQKGVPRHVLTNFLIWQAVVIVVYLVNEFWPLKFWTRFIYIFPDTGVHHAGKGLGLAIWIPAVLNAYVIGVLTHQTGGPSTSPYGQILIAMLVVGEQVRDVPQAPANATGWDFLRGAVKAYRGFALIAVLFYAGLVYAQEHHPINAKPASIWLVLSITFLVFATSSFTNYLSRAVRAK